MERSPFIVQLCYIPLRGRKITPGLALSLVLILAAISDHFAPDRCAYPAHTGLGIALIWEIAAPAGARRIPGKVDWVALILVLIPPSLLTTRQSLVWKDAESLWRHAIRAKGPSYLSRNQLGLTPIRNGLVEEGLGELRSAVTENPENPMAKGSLAIACVQNAYLNGGVRHFQEAGTSLPGRERFRAGIIASCLTAGRKDLATTLGKGAVAEDPAQATVRIGSGDYFYGIADHEEAMRHYAEAAKLDPRSSHAAVSIGALLIRRGSVEEANPWLSPHLRAGSRRERARGRSKSDRRRRPRVRCRPARD